MKLVVVTSYLVILLFKWSTGDIISAKCEEYAKAVYVESDSPVLSRAAKKDVVSECGIVSVPLIVGGTKASEKEFPHMAVIGFGITPRSSLTWDCGGSLISESFILTAAHCLESREKGAAQKVRLGLVYLERLDPDSQERLVSERIPHPGYRSPSKANDIGLVKLDRIVEFTANVRPACLSSKTINPGQKAIASGFGKLSYSEEHGSKDLMKVSLEIYNNEQCSKVMSGKEPMLESMLCAGQMTGGKDTCQGDSGGPLQIVQDEPYCMYSIIGITSFGKFCGFANSPAIYTRVSAFIPWIESIVWK